MSVQTQIDRIEQNVKNTYSVLSALGADLPANQNSDNLATTAGTAKAVLYSKQSINESQKKQARDNIGASSIVIQSEPPEDTSVLWLDPDDDEIDDAAGYIPVKGVDYWDEADQESIVQQVITALGTPVFGRVDVDNNIVLSGTLKKATYTVLYENADGSMIEIGMIGFAYENLADQTSADWLSGKRINSSGELKDAPGWDMTNFIQISADTKKIHIKGLDILNEYGGTNYGRVYSYNAAKTYVDYKQPSTLPSYFYVADYDDTVIVFDVEAARATSSMNSVTGAAYLRFGGIVTADKVIITIDENIQ